MTHAKSVLYYWWLSIKIFTKKWLWHMLSSLKAFCNSVIQNVLRTSKYLIPSWLNILNQHKTFISIAVLTTKLCNNSWQKNLVFLSSINFSSLQWRSTFWNSEITHYFYLGNFWCLLIPSVGGWGCLKEILDKDKQEPFLIYLLLSWIILFHSFDGNILASLASWEFSKSKRVTFIDFSF